MKFLVAVLLLDDGGNTQQRAVEALGPYSESIRVSPYETECVCVGTLAWAAAEKEGDRTYPERVDSFWEMDEGSRPLWEDFAPEWCALVDRLASEHPMWGRASPECEFCGGTGTVMSVHNPRARHEHFRFRELRTISEFSAEDYPWAYISLHGAWHEPENDDADARSVYLSGLLDLARSSPQALAVVFLCKR